MSALNDIYGITYNCPKNVQDKDCPLYEIRKLTFKQRVNWIDNLDDDTKKAILKYHYCCTKKK